MRNRAAIVTGGVTGVGRAITVALLQDGFTVFVCDLDMERGGKMEQEFPGQVTFMKTDISKEEDVRALFEIVPGLGKPLYAVVNNAGIIRRRTPGGEISVKDWDTVINVNLRGTFLMCKYASAALKLQGAGRIVNITSIAGKVGDITSAFGYGPSKAAIDALTKSFARELAPLGITVNAVAPHAIETEMSAEWSAEKRKAVIGAIPLGRMGRPEEVAAAVKFLLSEDAGFITGEVLDVNGGFLMD